MKQGVAQTADLDVGEGSGSDSGAGGTPAPATPRHGRSRRWLGITAVQLVLMLCAAVMLAPLVFTFFSSFKPLEELLSTTGGILPEQWTWSNYADAWTRGNFAIMFRNSIIITLGTVVLDVIASSMCGYVFARKKLRGQRLLESLFIATLFVGLTTAVLYPQFIIARALGMANMVGIIVVQFVGIMIVHIYLIKAYLKGQSVELEQAARVDGCGLFRVWWFIVFPLLRPILITTIILGFRASWNNFQVPLVFTLNEPQMQTVVIGVSALRFSGIGGVNATDILLAGANIALIPIIIVFLILQRYFVEGLTEGSLKG